jgi:hypothetical protein
MILLKLPLLPLLLRNELKINLGESLETTVEKTVKILVFNNEFEGKLLEAILNDRKIPHIIRSYHDSAYDGLWQTQSCWGHIEAPEIYKEEILEIYSKMG